MKSLYSSAALSASLLLTAAGFAAPPKDTISDGVVKIGVLTDMSGVYSTLGGKGTQVGVEMAVKDFGGKVLGKPIVVIGADHQNKADIASAKAREWFDNEKVDMITGLLNSGCALAVQKLGGDKKRITMNTGAASTELTNGAWPVTLPRAWCRPAARAGSSSPPTTPSASPWRGTPPSL